MTSDGYRNEDDSRQRQYNRGGDPSRIESLLHSLIDRLEETDSRYAASLSSLESRLNEVAERAGEAEAGESQAAAEARDRVGGRAAALAEQVREAEQAQQTQAAHEADETFRAIENRIGEFAAQLQGGGNVPGAAPQPPASAPGGAPDEPADNALGQRFADVAADFEQSLAAGHATAGLDDLNADAEELAQHFDSSLEGRDNAATLRSIEEQLNDLCAQFAEARQHYGRVDTIENHLFHLLERTQIAESHVEAAARKAAQETVRHMDPGAGGVTDRLDAVQRELRALGERAQATDGRTADTLESMNAALRSLSDQLAGGGAAAGGPAVPPDDDPAQTRHAAEPDLQPERRAAEPDPASERNLFAPDEDSGAPAQAPEKEDDFLASARRAAQAAAARPETGERKRRLLSRFRRKTAPPSASEADSGNKNKGKAPRSLLVMAVIFLLVASTALLYGRLTGGDTTKLLPSGAETTPSQGAPEETGDIGNKNADRKPQPASEPRARALRAPLAAEPATRSGKQGNSASAEDGNAGTEATSVPQLPVDPGIPGIAVRINQAGSGADEPPEETGNAGADSSPPPVPWTPQKKRARPESASHKPQETGQQTGQQPEPAARKAAMPPAALGPQSLRLAATKGNAQAQYEVGVRYVAGKGVKRDQQKAAEWFGRAAAQGLAPAQYRLAALHESGQGVEKDAALARVWYERAAKQGNIKAMHNLAVMLTAGEDRNADYETAVKWFTEAARHGLTDSQFNLGILYEAGLGVKKNPADAYRWFSLAARRGDEEAEKRKQGVREQLRPEQIRNADRSLRQWRPKPAEKVANEVRPPEGGWREAATGGPAAPHALITKAQKLLNELGYDSGVPDGRFGPRTKAAVRRFEERNDLQPSGEVTPELVSRLEARAS